MQSWTEWFIISTLSSAWMKSLVCVGIIITSELIKLFQTIRISFLFSSPIFIFNLQTTHMTQRQPADCINSLIRSLSTYCKHSICIWLFSLFICIFSYFQTLRFFFLSIQLRAKYFLEHFFFSVSTSAQF